jgi:hypothetical protein
LRSSGTVGGNCSFCLPALRVTDRMIAMKY